MESVCACGAATAAAAASASERIRLRNAALGDDGFHQLDGFFAGSAAHVAGAIIMIVGVDAGEVAIDLRALRPVFQGGTQALVAICLCCGVRAANCSGVKVGGAGGAGGVLLIS